MADTPIPISDDSRQILQAAYLGDLEFFQRLRNEEDFRRLCEVAKKPEPNTGRTCLHTAALEGHIQICRFLVEKLNHDVDSKCHLGYSPMLVAAKRGHFDVVKYLIIRKADVKVSDCEGNTCLHIAAVAGNRDIMKLLLLKGADKEAHSVQGTPLQCVVMRGTENIDSVRFLLNRGANPNAVSLLSKPSLVWAIERRSTECFEQLMKDGADPNINWNGLSPLAVAASNEDCIWFLRSLLAAGANPNSPTIETMIPIEYAAKEDNLEGLRILLPVTQRISRYPDPDWSINGIKVCFHSEEAKIQINEGQVTYFQFLDELGKIAVKQKYYSIAVQCFSEALYFKVDTERLLLNRCACWANLDKPNFCLHDAVAFLRLRPKCSKAHLIVGFAWMLLKCFTKAFKSFQMASSFDRNDTAIKEALSLSCFGAFETS